MTRIVIAPDKFKGSLTAVEAAEAIAAGTASGVMLTEVMSLSVSPALLRA